MDNKVYEKAVKFLTARMHTTGELYGKLKKRGFSDSDIRPVIKKLEELKFLNDGKFAELFVENCRMYKDYGYFLIKAKLQQKLVPENEAQAALQDFFAIEDEIAVARRVAAKLKKTGRKEWGQLARSLTNRGFRTEAVRTAIGEETNT